MGFLGILLTHTFVYVDSLACLLPCIKPIFLIALLHIIHGFTCRPRRIKLSQTLPVPKPPMSLYGSSTMFDTSWFGENFWTLIVCKRAYFCNAILRVFLFKCFKVTPTARASACIIAASVIDAWHHQPLQFRETQWCERVIKGYLAAMTAIHLTGQS